MRLYLYYLILLIRGFFFTLSRLAFVLIMLVLAIYLFYINDQGQDMMAAFGFLHVFRDMYLAVFVIFLFLWAGVIWNVSRVLLGAANLRKIVEDAANPGRILPAGTTLPDGYLIARYDRNYIRMLERMIRWVPRLLGMVPYALFIGAYLKQNKVYDGNLVFITLLAVGHLVYFLSRKKIASVLPVFRRKAVRPSADAYDTHGERDVWRAVRRTDTYYNTWLSVIVAVIVFSYAIWAAFNIRADEGKPGLIIISALIVYTMLGLVINIYSNRYRLPFFLLLVLFAILAASRFNNNHRVQVLTSAHDDSLLKMRVSDTAYFSRWLNDKFREGVYVKGDSTNTIFLVAAEGGGIRNTYWTFQVMAELQQRYPDLYKKTFMATGASGGSVGLGFFYHYLYQHNRDWYTNKGFRLSRGQRDSLDKICSADYLSRVSFGFLFPDLVQRFLPFKVGAFDRGRYLAASFDDGYSKWSGPKERHLLSRNYLDMWSDSNAYKYPAILFNAIYNERGSKAIFSPYKLSARYYADALDILSVTRQSVPYREAMVSSARFPLVTPPGLLQYKLRDTLRNLGHISDGGGFDNTAIQSVQQTAIMIKRSLERLNAGKFRLVLLYIGYGTEPLIPRDSPDNQEFVAALGGSYELAPLIGGYNAIFRWIYSGHGMSIELDSTLNVLQFGLRNKFDSTTHQLPLGWYLSPASKSMIRDEMKDQRNVALQATLREFDRLVK